MMLLWQVDNWLTVLSLVCFAMYALYALIKFFVAKLCIMFIHVKDIITRKLKPEKK